MAVVLGENWRCLGLFCIFPHRCLSLRACLNESVLIMLQPKDSCLLSLSFCDLLPHQVFAFHSSPAPDTCVAVLGVAGLEHFSFILSKSCLSSVTLDVELGGTRPVLLSTQLCVPALCSGALVEKAQEKGVGMWGCFNHSFPKCCSQCIQHSSPSVSTPGNPCHPCEIETAKF